MKSLRWAVLLAAVLVLTNVANADTVDPAIGVKGNTGIGSQVWGDGAGAGSISVFFSPSTPGVTCVGGVCSYTTLSADAFFINSGSITDFKYSFDQSQSTGFSVAVDSVFNLLTIVNDIGSSNPIAFLSGGTIVPACIDTCTFDSPTIPGEFLLEASGVTEGTTVTFTSNVPIPTPEPASLGLLLSGLGVLAVRRLRKGSKAWSAAV